MAINKYDDSKELVIPMYPDEELLEMFCGCSLKSGGIHSLELVQRARIRYEKFCLYLLENGD